MTDSTSNRFQTLFREGKYILLKNYLYNYRLRKRAVQKQLRKDRPQWILETGSGISPLITDTEQIIFSDVSFSALKILKRAHGKGDYVVADAMDLPFKPGVFSHAVSSEVLEHLADDRRALSELARVMQPPARLIITFPHRKIYFANDDRFVSHYRRYELPEMENLLQEAGFRPRSVKKVLGPLEKATMCLVVLCFSLIQQRSSPTEKKTPNLHLMNMVAVVFDWLNRFYMGWVWLDARVMPRSMSAVLLIDSIMPDSQ